jgi:hypothetical protein
MAAQPSFALYPNHLRRVVKTDCADLKTVQKDDAHIQLGAHWASAEN